MEFYASGGCGGECGFGGKSGWDGDEGAADGHCGLNMCDNDN